VIVTVSRAYGASANAVARCAASELRYRVVDDELEVVVATRLGAPREVVESVGDRPARFGDRVLEELAGGVPETAQPAQTLDDLADERRREIEEAVRASAAAGNAIILGRAAGTILAGRPDLVRVFLHAPLAWRIAQIARGQGIGEAEARAEIARIDEARRRYAREYYRVAWGEPQHYDLVVDTSRFGIEGAAAVIVAAVRATGA
jgi:cytidylate kinase